MTSLTDEMKEALLKTELVPLATSSNSGIPNVIPIKYVLVENPQELWLVDNYMTKTLDNLTHNPVAAMYVYWPDEKLCFQIKGRINVRQSGSDYERMRAIVHRERPEMPARSLIILHITDIYQCLPGPDAGARIDC